MALTVSRCQLLCKWTSFLSLRVKDGHNFISLLSDTWLIAGDDFPNLSEFAKEIERASLRNAHKQQDELHFKAGTSQSQFKEALIINNSQIEQQNLLTHDLMATVTHFNYHDDQHSHSNFANSNTYHHIG